MIVVNGINHYQLAADAATGQQLTVTPEQQKADNWPPPDGTLCHHSPDKKTVKTSK